SHHAYYNGDWTQARASLERATATTRGFEPPLYLGVLCLVEGQSEMAAAYMAESLAMAERQHDMLMLRPTHRILAERDLLTGCAEAACARLEPLLDRPGMQEPQTQYVLPQLAWAYLELGDEQRAEAVAAESRARAVADRHHLFLVDALCVQAMVRIRQARWQEAVEALEESLALCRAMPYP